MGEALRELASEFDPPDESGSAAGEREGMRAGAGAAESIDERTDGDVRAVGSVVTMQVRTSPPLSASGLLRSVEGAASREHS